MIKSSMKIMDITEAQKIQLNDFCRRNQVALFIIFGSYAKGKTHPNSDLDIALSFENNKLSIDKLRLIFELEGIFEKQVDLVILKPMTDPLLRFEVFSRGRPLYMSKPHLFEVGKLYAWKLYLDTTNIRMLKEQYVKNYIRKLKDDRRSRISEERTVD